MGRGCLVTLSFFSDSSQRERSVGETDLLYTYTNTRERCNQAQLTAKRGSLRLPRMSRRVRAPRPRGRTSLEEARVCMFFVGELNCLSADTSVDGATGNPQIVLVDHWN